MERLTNEKHGNVRSIRFPLDEIEALEWARRLAEYEDTGLTPKEITAMQAELAEYREKEADGQMMELPCKVGDTAWFACVAHEPKEMEIEYVNIVLCADRRIVEVKAKGVFTRYVFGKTVFLTPEAAEAALKGGDGE